MEEINDITGDYRLIAHIDDETIAILILEIGIDAIFISKAVDTELDNRATAFFICKVFCLGTSFYRKKK